MPKFRKKPVVIEAIQFSEILGGQPLMDDLWPDWLRDAHQLAEGQTGALWTERMPDAAETDILVIGTLEGNHTVSPGDWIIRGVKGELYPCKPDIFSATYEPAEPEQARA